MSTASAAPTGAQLIALTLRSLGIPIIFGIVGIPIIEVAEACVALGIRFVGFRNEQAASYAASAYGYITGRPGVLLVVGGPGVVHALSGIYGAQTNHFPLLVLCGSIPSTHLPTQGCFQTLSATTFLAPHTKRSLRAPTPSQLPQCIREAYRTAFWGRPGATAVEINGDYVTHKFGSEELEGLIYPNGQLAVTPVPDGPKPEGDRDRIKSLAKLLMNGAKRPLLVVGKGAAYARCEDILKVFVEKTSIPFLPTPMGKGLLPDNHPLDASAARSHALSSADLIILLGARLNWILHFGQPPKFSPGVKIAKIEISAEEIGRNLDIPGVTASGATGEELGIVGDCGAVLAQLLEELEGWEGLGGGGHSGYESHSPEWLTELHKSRDSSILKLRPKLLTKTAPGRKLTYHRTFHLLQETFASLGGSGRGGVSDNVVYVSEGANTMDISRSIFPITLPRQRLDAGTDATMGVGLGYAIAAWCAYNLPPPTSTTHSPNSSSTAILGQPPRKKIIAIEGDSAFGFSGMELETMSRYNMDIIVIVINNGGVYRGVNYTTTSTSTHLNTPTRDDPFPDETKSWETDPRRKDMTLPSTALSYRTRYAKMADALGGKGWEVWGSGEEVERQLKKSAKEAWEWGDKERKPVVLDVGIEAGKGGELVFAWLGGEKGGKQGPKL